MAVATVSVRCVCALLAIGLPASAWAQAPRPPAFRPDISAGFVFDDNVFRQSRAVADLVFRVTPGFELKHESTRVTLGTHYRFDAERYNEHASLDTPLARQSTGLDLTLRPVSRTAVHLHGGYERTETAQDLNLSTGLVIGRQRASRREMSADLRYAFRPNRTLAIGYAYSFDVIARGVGNGSNTGRLQWSQRLGARQELSVAYRFEQRDFSPGSPVVSQIAMAGLSNHVSPRLTIGLEGGIRQVADQAKPEVLVTLVRQVGAPASLLFSYMHTQGVAVGVGGLIPVDGVTASFGARRSNRWELTLSGSAFRNVVHATEVMTYDMTVSVGRGLRRGVWLVGTGSASLNSSDVNGAIVSHQEIRRNAVSLQLRVAPWSTSR